MKLTNTAVVNAKPKDKDYKMFDGGGMFLLVKKDGSKYWRLKYRFFGKEKLLALGVFPQTTLKEARCKKEDAKKLIENGQDPNVVKQKIKQQINAETENIFENVAKAWHENNIGNWTPENALRVWRRLERNIIPTIGKKPVNEIKPSEILALIQVMEKRGATYLSKKTLQTCAAVFRYAKACDMTEYNPASDLKDALKPHKVKHHPAIGAKELPTFLKKLEGIPAAATNKMAVRLLLLTFLRQGELRKCKWEYIDYENKQMIVPAEIMKMRDSHIVPLAPQSMELLKEIHIFNGWSDYIFPAMHRRKNPYISENTINNIIHKMGYKGEMVAHGARSLASTILNEQGFREDVIEKQLAHKDRNQIRGIYNRAEYLIERHDMMNWWGEYIKRAENGWCNVIEGNFNKGAAS